MPADQFISNTYTIDGHQFTARKIAAGLHVVATPIGNLRDITLRALQTLSAADLIYCEDTRVSSRLLARYQINTTLKPYHDHNAAKQRPRILSALHDGAAIALISDAGTPLVSDPGYKLVSACLEHGIAVDTAPGPSAALAALALAGLPSDQFRFCGFLPSRSHARITALVQLTADPLTAIMYESPRRLAALLADIAKTTPTSQIAICRELTKMHQEVLKGTAAELTAQLLERPALKGEVTVVLAPAPPTATDIESPEVERELLLALASNPPAKAAGLVAKQFSLKKTDIYTLAMSLKQNRSSDE